MTRTQSTSVVRASSSRRLRVVGTGVAAVVGMSMLTGFSTADVDDSRPTADSTVTYEPSGEVIANPERGFYRAADTHYEADRSGYVPLDAEVLEGYRAEGVTQVYRGFYLERFAAGDPLDAEYLDLVRADFDSAREAGVSLIVRFAYRTGGATLAPPYGDAPLDVVLADIEQLGPVLQENSDVITVLQAGFIGLWGEWYYTDHFATDPANPGALTDEDWAKRRQVVAALLDAVPDDRMIQVRAPNMKQTVLGVPTGPGGGLTEQEGYSRSDKARIGHHNDCLLASPDDFGTFLSDPISLDQEYLDEDSGWTAVGGETCAVNAPRSEFPSAAAELERYHYSFLNADYNTDVLNSWGSDGLREVSQRLGYRFVLTESRVDADRIEVDVRNDGWSAPSNPRPVHLVLTGDAGTWVVDTGTDARTWRPGETSTLAVDVCGVPAGSYTVALDLPSADASLAGNPDYSVQTANTGTWDAASGFNDLDQTLTVDAPASGCDTPAEPVEG